MIRVGRLRIDAGALSPAEGVRLAELVAAALARTSPRRGPATYPSLTVAVAAPRGQGLADLADGIAAAIARALPDAQPDGGEAG